MEVRCLTNKLNKIRYELDCVVIPKNLLQMCFILIRGFSGQASELCQSALAMCRSALQECQLALLRAKPHFQFWFNLDSFFRDFMSRELYLDVVRDHASFEGVLSKRDLGA